MVAVIYLYIYLFILILLTAVGNIILQLQSVVSRTSNIIIPFTMPPSFKNGYYSKQNDANKLKFYFLEEIFSSLFFFFNRAKFSCHTMLLLDQDKFSYHCSNKILARTILSHRKENMFFFHRVILERVFTRRHA